jgi:serine/threonine protein kinase/Tfp pilus assembly protein PilF
MGGDLADTPVAGRIEPERAGPADDSRGVRLGGRVGPYRTVELLGRGGMGAVYLAVREDDFEKRVALKVIKRGMDTDEIIRRFENERQILAQLEHPYIARLLDGGTTEDGLPYFVMEYVEGEPIDGYCDSRKLPVKARLQLFLEVCSALHASHQRLVVHRDLKPGNILIAADGTPRLLDFGIAKLLDTEAYPRDEPSSRGPEPMTPEWASPEQFLDTPITTASDVYSCGVLLFYLLSGRRPYRVAGRGTIEIFKAICDEEPARLSAVVLDELEGPLEVRPKDEVIRRTAEEVAADRGTTPRGLQRRLHGDLESIVAKALRKEPPQRYGSIESLAADVRRHLGGLPVQARAGSFAYTATRFVRRHRGALAAGLAILLLAAFFTLAMIAQLRETRRALERAETVSEFLEDLFEAPDPDRSKGREVTALEILDAGKARIAEYRERDPMLYGRLVTTMADVYRKLGVLEEARPLLEDAIEVMRRELGRKDHPELAIAVNDLAVVVFQEADYERAAVLLREALDMKVRLYGEEAPDTVTTMNNLAAVSKAQGDLETAKRLHRRCLKLLQNLHPPDPEALAVTLANLGVLLLDEQQYREAEQYFRQALDRRRALYESDHTNLAKVHHNLGVALDGRGELEEAEEHYREALRIRRRLLDEGHPSIASTRAGLASVLVATGRHAEAEILARQALETLEAQSPDLWRAAYAQTVLGSALDGQGKHPEAEAMLTAGYSRLVEIRPPCDRYVFGAQQRLAELYRNWRKPEESVRFERLADGCRRQLAQGKNAASR